MSKKCNRNKNCAISSSLDAPFLMYHISEGGACVRWRGGESPVPWHYGQSKSVVKSQCDPVILVFFCWLFSRLRLYYCDTYDAVCDAERRNDSRCHVLGWCPTAALLAL